MSGGLLVMCCGCHGFLGLNGEVVKADQGIEILLEGRIIHVPAEDLVASFPDVAVAGDFMKSHGWTVERAAFGNRFENHRCPECALIEARARARGTYEYGMQGAILQVDRIQGTAIRKG